MVALIDPQFKRHFDSPMLEVGSFLPGIPKKCVAFPANPIYDEAESSALTQSDGECCPLMETRKIPCLFSDGGFKKSKEAPERNARSDAS